MPLKLIKRGRYWHYRGTVAGRQLRRSTGATDRKTAEKIKAEVEADVWAGRHDAIETRLTMAQAFYAYRQAEKPIRFLERLEDYWKDTRVCEITPGQIEQSAKILYPNAKPATRNRQVIVPTQAVINHAAGLGWASSIKVKRFKVEKIPANYVTDEWVTKFQAHASPHLGALCRSMFETGARVGEAVRLTWADVDFAERTIVIGRTKIGEGRTARITPRVLEALANMPSNRQPEAIVFGYAASKSVNQVWDNAIKRAGIERKTPHACRHGFATAALRKGVDVKTVAKWGGWKDPRVLLDTYAHAIEDPTVIDEVFGTKSAQSDNDEQLSNSK